MCRMLIAVGNVNINKLLDGIILMASDQNSRHELNKEKGKGSWSHADGWGIAYRNSADKWVIEKSTMAIYEDPKVDSFRNIKTNIAILHARKKIGSKTSLPNTHPFIAEKEGVGSCVFCHNGFIEDEIKYSSKFTPQGKTDSEKLFYSILTDLKRDDAVQAIQTNFKRYHKLRGTNVILSTPHRSFVAVRKNLFPQYYQMQIGRTTDQVIISSEVLPTVPGALWEPIEQGEIVTINHDDLSVTKNRIQ